MNEKSFFIVVGIIAVIFSVLFVFTGCATRPQVGITELAASGNYEIGRLAQLDKDLERITQSARVELARAGDSTLELGEIIQRIFGIAFELCNEIDNLRGEISRRTILEFSPGVGSSGTVDAEDSPNNTGLR